MHPISSPYLADPVNQAFLQHISDIRDAGTPASTIDEFVLHYFIYNSWSMAPSDFGGQAKIAQRFAARLHESGVDVRRTVPNFLWGDGATPQSQLAKFCATNNRWAKSYIFIDVVGPNLHELELLDSLVHESIHSTGPLLGRWKPEDQPTPEYGTHRMSDAYLYEEAIAVGGALKLMAALGVGTQYIASIGVKTPFEAGETSKIIQWLVEQHGANRQMFPVKEIEKKTDDAVNYLLKPPSRRATLMRAFWGWMSRRDR